MDRYPTGGVLISPAALLNLDSAHSTMNLAACQLNVGAPAGGGYSLFELSHRLINWFKRSFDVLMNAYLSGIQLGAVHEQQSGD